MEITFQILSLTAFVRKWRFCSNSSLSISVALFHLFSFSFVLLRQIPNDELHIANTLNLFYFSGVKREARRKTKTKFFRNFKIVPAIWFISEISTWNYHESIFCNAHALNHEFNHALHVALTTIIPHNFAIVKGFYWILFYFETFQLRYLTNSAHLFGLRLHSSENISSTIRFLTTFSPLILFRPKTDTPKR